MAAYIAKNQSSNGRQIQDKHRDSQENGHRASINLCKTRPITVYFPYLNDFTTY